MLHSKKALSPLIAAVLLIVVVVGIGAVVTGIVRSLVSENQETIRGKSGEMSCSRDVSVDLILIDDEYQLCKGSDYISAVVENTGTGDIDDFQLIVMATTGFYNNDSLGTGTFVSGAAMEVNGTFSGITASDIEQVKLVPKLKKSGSAQYHFCSEVAVKSEVIPDC
jgi:FlaG/FlaF family flagellin (archaellin)